MNTCETCIHWIDNDGWDDMVSRATYPEDPAVKEIREKHNRESGRCSKINEGWMWNGESPLPLATCWDGSQYMATLHTHKNFGCVLHETSEDPPRLIG